MSQQQQVTSMVERKAARYEERCQRSLCTQRLRLSKSCFARTRSYHLERDAVGSGVGTRAPPRAVMGRAMFPSRTQGHGCPQEDALSELSGTGVQPVSTQEDHFTRRQCAPAEGQAELQTARVRAQAGAQGTRTQNSDRGGEFGPCRYLCWDPIRLSPSALPAPQSSRVPRE